MDKKGLKKEADHLDQIIKKIAGRKEDRGWTGGRSRHGREIENRRKEEFNKLHEGQERVFSKENIPPDMLEKVLQQSSTKGTRDSLREKHLSEQREEFARKQTEKARKDNEDRESREDARIWRDLYDRADKTPSTGDEDPELPPDPDAPPYTPKHHSPAPSPQGLSGVEHSISKIEERLIRIENILIKLESMWR